MDEERLPIPPSPRKKRRNLRVLDAPSGKPPFGLLPRRQGLLLARAGFRSPEEVMTTTDDEILLAPGISRWTLAVIRAAYPYAGGPPPSLMICPCCGGLGRVRRFAYKPSPQKR